MSRDYPERSLWGSWMSDERPDRYTQNQADNSHVDRAAVCRTRLQGCVAAQSRFCTLNRSRDPRALLVRQDGCQTRSLIDIRGTVQVTHMLTGQPCAGRDCRVVLRRRAGFVPSTGLGIPRALLVRQVGQATGTPDCLLWNRS